MRYFRYTFVYTLLMAFVVVASNFLVQFPLAGTLFGVQLGDLLTWGAFSYPVAFLVTDLTNRLRRQTWWRAPLAGSLAGSAIDTALFFSIAFASVFILLGPNDPFAIESAPILGILSMEAPRWISWALGDLGVKVLVGVVMLLPYGALMSVLKPMPPAQRAQ